MLILLSILLRLVPSGLREKVVAGNRCLRELHEADLAASMAGGDSFSDIYGLFRFFYVALPQILVLCFGKPLILLPQTLGPFKRTMARLVSRFIVRGAERVYSRDMAGIQEVGPWLRPDVRPTRLRFCYDVGFVLDPIRPAAVDVTGFDFSSAAAGANRQGPPLVGLNVSGLLAIGGFTRNNMFGLKVDYDRLTHGLIDFLIEKKGARVLLVPHVFGEGGESDPAHCARLYEELKSKHPNRLGVVQRVYNQSEIKYVIGNCDFFIGARMHSCIAAVSQCVPAISIAYSDKFVGVMSTVGIEGLVADARKLDQDAILRIVGNAYDSRKVLRGQLENKIPEVKEMVLNLFNGLTGIVPSTTPSAASKVDLTVRA
jgi:polysaccharide pyruvyl transferase WcaK-like protein